MECRSYRSRAWIAATATRGATTSPRSTTTSSCGVGSPAGAPASEIAAVADEDMTTDRDDVDAIVSGLMHGAQPPADAVTGEDVIPAWQPTNRGDRR